MKTIYYTINIWRTIIAYLLIRACSNREMIVEEIFYWGKCAGKNNQSYFRLLSCLLLEMKEYRNLLYMRIRSNRGGIRSAIFRLFFPLKDTLALCCTNIGKNLYIQHGFATQISAQSIGENCLINQQVTIGYSFDDKPPIIGNGVRISAGAKVIGNINIGNNAIIGANAVVTKNVADNDIVVGVPAKPIKKNVDHCLWISD